MIDYDRLTLDTQDTDYYVSFDNEAVGSTTARVSSSASRTTATTPAVALLNGSPTDNNATLFKNGYEKVITRSSSGD